MKNRSRGFFKGKMILFVIVAAGALTLALMLLWNWLMPVIFGLTTITFWQALGLLIMSKIIFGKGHRPNWKNRNRSNKHKEMFMERFAKSKGRCMQEKEIKEETN